jgi:co-chaperonin GroES (HSP10)
MGQRELEAARAKLERFHEEVEEAPGMVALAQQASGDEVTALEMLDDWLLLERDEAGEQVGAGGIFLPQQSQRKARPHCGVVVSVGPGLLRSLPNGGVTGERVALDCCVGDRVYYQDTAVVAIVHGGREYLAMPESKVICKWKR